MLFAKGILTWDSNERRSQRYGFFYLAKKDFDEQFSCEDFFFDIDCMKQYARVINGKRVKITAKVIENRKSGHFGDAFLEITPTMPDLNEEIVIGVGTFMYIHESFAPAGYAIGIKPSDGRKVLWLDPRNLYKLHDQTVELYIEETDEPDSPLTTLRDNGVEGVVSNGDGSCQIREKDFVDGEVMTILPKIERLGDGFFTVTPPNQSKKGEVLQIKK